MAPCDVLSTQMSPYRSHSQIGATHSDHVGGRPCQCVPIPLMMIQPLWHFLQGGRLSWSGPLYLKPASRQRSVLGIWPSYLKPRVQSDGCRAMYHASGVLAEMDSYSQACALGSVGRGVN